MKALGLTGEVAPNPTACKWQSRDPNPGLWGLKTYAVLPCHVALLIGDLANDLPTIPPAPSYPDAKLEKMGVGKNRKNVNKGECGRVSKG